jgi:hypothetical protein
MSHLDVVRLLSVLKGEGTAHERAHLDGCANCSHELEVWRPRLAGLRELASSTVAPAEFHNLRVLFRSLGPRPEGRSWVARMLHGPELAAAPVRGGLEATLGAYRAGPYEIVIEVRPSEIKGRFDVHGQVVDDDGVAPEPAEVVLTSPEGYADRVRLDAYGEFRLVGVPPGRSRLAWVVGDSRIDLEELEIGEPNDEAGG